MQREKKTKNQGTRQILHTIKPPFLQFADNQIQLKLETAVGFCPIETTVGVFSLLFFFLSRRGIAVLMKIHTIAT